MSKLLNCITDKQTSYMPIWFMRQAGRYLPEFREIRKNNQDFIKLCLNENLSSEITLQPIKRFDFDAAIIFSDILMIPFAINQDVKFEKGFGPKLGNLNIDAISKINEADFTNKLNPVYNAISLTAQNTLLKDKDLIGFVGAPWTILVYMINKMSPKKGIPENFFKDISLLNNLLVIIEKFIKLHIKNQIKAGANVIQIFDSWAGLLENKIPEFLGFKFSTICKNFKKLKLIFSICYFKF